MEEVMRYHSYLLLLDDINHIKHFRSHQLVKEEYTIQHSAVRRTTGMAACQTPAVKSGSV